MVKSLHGEDHFRQPGHQPSSTLRAVCCLQNKHTASCVPLPHMHSHACTHTYTHTQKTTPDVVYTTSRHNYQSGRRPVLVLCRYRHEAKAHSWRKQKKKGLKPQRSYKNTSVKHSWVLQQDEEAPSQVQHVGSSCLSLNV